MDALLLRPAWVHHRRLYNFSGEIQGIQPLRIFKSTLFNNKRKNETVTNNDRAAKPVKVYYSIVPSFNG